MMLEPIRSAVLTGQVTARDPDHFPVRIVEGLTEFDYSDLPDELRDGLRDWCEAFYRWSLQ